MDIIYEDNHLLVVNKPAGQLVQGDQTGRSTLLDEAKEYLRQKFNKPGNVYLGLVHRLDRTTSGVVVLARTSKAASRLSEEIRRHKPEKTYWALVEGKVPPKSQWTDLLQRDEYSSQVVRGSEGKDARLSFERLGYQQEISLVEIILETGRHHQIRVQFSHRGFPVLGDKRYGSKKYFTDDSIALHARKLRINHPTEKHELHLVAEPSADWQPYLGTLLQRIDALWQIYRLDDHGNRFMVARNLSENDADELIREYEQKGHKQIYGKEIQDA